jgi:flagellar hook-associated protein 3 FlgL
MQIGNNQFYQSQVSRMTDLQTSIGKIQEQIASGKQLSVPSDNPAAYARVQSLKAQEASLTQYDNNITIAQQSLSQEGTVLNQVSTILTRVKELTIQGNNGTNNATDRQAIAKELAQDYDQLKTLANTQDANGDYIFSGTASKVQPFASDTSLDPTSTVPTVIYQGNDGRRNVPIGNGLTTAMASNGQEVFMSVPVGGNPPQTTSIFSMLQKTIDAFNNGQATSTTDPDIQSAIDHTSIYESINGARLNKANSTQQSQQALMTQLQSAQSGLEDTDVTAAATKLSQQTLDLNAAEASFSKIAQLSLFNYLK